MRGEIIPTVDRIEHTGNGTAAQASPAQPVSAFSPSARPSPRPLVHSPHTTVSPRLLVSHISLHPLPSPPSPLPSSTTFTTTTTRVVCLVTSRSPHAYPSPHCPLYASSEPFRPLHTPIPTSMPFFRWLSTDPQNILDAQRIHQAQSKHYDPIISSSLSHLIYSARPPSVRKNPHPPVPPRAKKTQRLRNVPSPPTCSSLKTGVSASRPKTHPPALARWESSSAQSGRSSTTKRKKWDFQPDYPARPISSPLHLALYRTSCQRQDTRRRRKGCLRCTSLTLLLLTSSLSRPPRAARRASPATATRMKTRTKSDSP